MRETPGAAETCFRKSGHHKPLTARQQGQKMAIGQKSDRSAAYQNAHTRRSGRRFHKHGTTGGWKGRKTQLRPCGAPGDETWDPQVAGE